MRILSINLIKALSEVAAKRLQAIRDFTELGAGFKIAMRDLEIRGAGNLLESEAAWSITGIGFSLIAKCWSRRLTA